MDTKKDHHVTVPGRRWFETATQGILVLDRGGRVVDANPHACGLLGVDLEQLKGVALLERLPAEGFRGRIGVVPPGRERMLLEASVAGWEEGLLVTFSGSGGPGRGFYRTLVESSHDALVLASADNRFLYANPAIERVLGYSPQELAGTVISDLVHPQDLEEFGRAAIKEIQSGRDYYGPLLGRYRHRDGSWRYLESYFNVLIEDPEVGGVVCSTRDVTDREESELRYRTLVELSPDAIVVYGADRRLLYINSAGLELFGLSSPEGVLGRDVLDFVHPDYRELAAGRSRRALEGERPGLVEQRLLRPNGGELEVEISSAPIVYGGRSAVLTVVRDVSERKKMERELERRAEELARSNRELERFAYVVSHDLQAPLRSVEGFSEILIEDCASELDAEGADYLRRIQTAAHSMRSIIDGLLELSRLSRVGVCPETFDLGLMAREVGAKLLEDCPGPAELRTAEGLTATADPRLVRMALENLLGNAWKFTAGERRAVIEFGQKDGAYYVADNGVGFEPQESEHIFEPFVRLQPGGAGLGLAVVRRVIQVHGGRAWAEGEVGKGATFYFTLGEG